MTIPRRNALRYGASLLAAPLVVRAQSATLEDAVLATPGPGSAVSMIPELAEKLGADRAEGVSLRLKFVSGGGVAIRELANGNAQFGVFGLPAAMKENLDGPHLVALAALEDRTLLSVMVRSDLKDSVRRVEDLRGRVLGVHSNSLSTMTTGQQFLVLVLRQAQVPPDAVRFVAAGQSWETQVATLRSRVADAIVSEEPFGVRLQQEGLAFALLRIGHQADASRLPGAGLLRGTLIATRETVERQPALAERLVRVMQRTLAWRRSRTPAEVVAMLGYTGAEARAFQAMFEQYPQQYSPDGRFSAAQMAQTEVFFRESAGNSPEATRYRVASMLVDRWAGSKP